MPALSPRAALAVILAIAGPGGLAPALAQVTAATATERVVLADPDPELQRAVATVLAPWHLEVIFDASAPSDATQAQQRADIQAARFVVWRSGDELVVFDRASGVAERREARSGSLDPVTAATAALTVKTLMRLPPPPEVAAAPEQEEEMIAAVAATAPPLITEPIAGPEIRVQAGVLTRVARGSQVDLGARFVGAALLRPSSRWGWRFGIAGDLGTRTAVQRAGFKGTWRDWAVVGVASWTHEGAGWELEPYLGAGVTSSTLVGTEMTVVRQEATMLATLRGGVGIRKRLQMWTIGGSLELDVAPSTPTYTKRDGGAATIFEVPSFGAVVGLVLAADLGR